MVRPNRELDCKTPKCPQKTTAIIGEPVEIEYVGHPFVQVEWVCGSCYTIWNSKVRKEYWDAGHNSD